MKKLLLVSIVAVAALQVGWAQAATPAKSVPANHQKSGSFLHREYAHAKKSWPVVKKDAKKAWGATKDESHKLYDKAKAKFHKSPQSK